MLVIDKESKDGCNMQRKKREMTKREDIYKNTGYQREGGIKKKEVLVKLP